MLLGTLSTAPLWKFLQQILAGQELQYVVVKELQLFIVLRWLNTYEVGGSQLRKGRAMRQSAPEQFGVLELVAQPVLELLILVGHRKNSQSTAARSIRSA